MSDDRLSAIGLHILEHYPSEKVKLTLAKYISARRFTGFNSRLAADTFLKAAGIEALGRDPIAVALREARKVVNNPPKVPAKKEEKGKDEKYNGRQQSKASVKSR